MAFELRYPNESAPTASWLPTVDPSEWTEKVQVPVMIQPMTDPAAVYRYRTSTSIIGVERYAWPDLKDSDKASFLTFLAAVGSSTFKYKDPVSGSYIVAAFEEYGWDWEHVAANCWALTMLLRRTL